MVAPAARVARPTLEDDERRRQSNWDMLIQVLKLMVPLIGFAVLGNLFEWGAALLVTAAFVGVAYAYGAFDGVGKLFESISNSELGVKIKAWIRENVPQLANVLGIENVVAMLEQVEDPSLVAGLLEAGGADKALATAVAATIKPATAGRPADNSEWKALLAAVKASGVSLEGGVDIFRKPEVIRAIAMAAEPRRTASVSAPTLADIQAATGLKPETKRRIFEAALTSRGVPPALAAKLAADPAHLVNVVFAGGKLKALLEGNYAVAFDKETLKEMQAYLGREGIKLALGSFSAAPANEDQRRMLAAINAAKAELMKDTAFLRTILSDEMKGYLVAAGIPEAMAIILAAKPDKLVDIFASDAAGVRKLGLLIDGKVAEAIDADTIVRLDQYISRSGQSVDRFMTALQELTVAAGVTPGAGNPIPAAFTNAVVELAKDESKLRQLDRGFIVGALKVLMQKGGLGGGDGSGLLARAPELLNLVKRLDPADIQTLVSGSNLGLGERPQQIVEWLRSPSSDGRRQNVDVIVGFLTSMKGNGIGLKEIIDTVASRSAEQLHRLITSTSPADLGEVLRGIKLDGLIQNSDTLANMQRAMGVLGYSPDNGKTFPNLALLKATVEKVGREDGLKIIEMINTVSSGGPLDLNTAMDLFARHKEAIRGLASGINLEGLPDELRANATVALNFIKHSSNMDNLIVYVKNQKFTSEEVTAFFKTFQTGDLMAAIKSSPSLLAKIKDNVDALGDLLSNKDGKGLDLRGVLEPTKLELLNRALVQGPPGGPKGYFMLQMLLGALVANVDSPLMKFAGLIEGVPRSGIRLDTAHDPDAERRSAEAAEAARRALLAIADAAKVNLPTMSVRQA